MEWNRDDAVAAYVDALQGMLAVAEALGDDEWPLPTDLPGWSVQDNVAHVTALEDQFAGRPVPEHLPDYAALPHVRNDAGRHMEIGVDTRRGLAPVDLLAELRTVVAERIPQIESLPDDPDFMVPGPLGNLRPLSVTLPIRAFDVWTHEQDVRRAVGVGERLTGPAAAVALESVLQALPVVLGKEAGLAGGTAVRLVVEPPGPAPSGLSVLVAVDADGRGRLADDESLTADVILSLSFAALIHAATGRRRPGAGELSVIGDESLAPRILDALVITP
jgi:uncharacterized protein (TIGR03083 family)